mgnify:CR=1 FL=1|jgi:hypothetical protein
MDMWQLHPWHLSTCEGVEGRIQLAAWLSNAAPHIVHTHVPGKPAQEPAGTCSVNSHLLVVMHGHGHMMTATKARTVAT